MLFREDEAARAQALQVRENVGWYLWTHDQVTLSGLDAEAFLDHMLVNRVAGLGVGRGRYTTMLNEEGRIIDDLVVTRVGEQEFWLSTLYGPHMVRWFDAHKGDADVTYADTTATWDMYSVQGPNAGTFMAELGVDVSELKRFQMVEATIVGKDVHIDRGGFTGELGYEIYVRRGEDSEAVYAALEAAGKKMDAPRLNILEVYVRSLPTEKGMALRQDYFGLTPYEAGLAGRCTWTRTSWARRPCSPSRRTTRRRVAHLWASSLSARATRTSHRARSCTSAACPWASAAR